MPTPVCPRLIGLLAVVSLTLSPLPVHAQQVDRSTDTVQAIRELTAEIRSLRGAVERAAQTQVQQQVVGLYLTLQQSRVTQATMRLDTVRRELERATLRAHELTDRATSLETELTTETDPEKHRALELAQVAMKQETQQNKAHEQQIRTREAEAFQAAQTEEARWAELASQLEQSLKR